MRYQVHYMRYQANYFRYHVHYLRYQVTKAITCVIKLPRSIHSVRRSETVTRYTACREKTRHLKLGENFSCTSYVTQATGR